MYVKPDSVASVFPDLTHGALTRTVCPLTGYIALTFTPPKNLAPSPTATTTASGRRSLLFPPINRLVPPLFGWYVAPTHCDRGCDHHFQRTALGDNWGKSEHQLRRLWTRLLKLCLDIRKLGKSWFSNMTSTDPLRYYIIIYASTTACNLLDAHCKINMILSTG